MLRELSVDRFQFACAGCGQDWIADYGVQHVEDGHGVAWDCYFRNGHRVTCPTARGVVCWPRCGARLVHVELIASQAVPVTASSIVPAWSDAADPGWLPERS